MKPSRDGSLRCSFCRKSSQDVGQLISNPGDYPRAYICNECIEVCAAILENDRREQAAPDQTSEGGRHELLEHPLAPNLLDAVIRWTREESLGKDGTSALAEVRAIADKMLTAAES